MTDDDPRHRSHTMDPQDGPVPRLCSMSEARPVDYGVLPRLPGL
jgi:hypothetical protein